MCFVKDSRCTPIWSTELVVTWFSVLGTKQKTLCEEIRGLADSMKNYIDKPIHGINKSNLLCHFYQLLNNFVIWTIYKAPNDYQKRLLFLKMLFRIIH